MLTRKGVRNFFENSYKQDDIPHIHLPMGVFKSFSIATSLSLDEIPDAEEMKKGNMMASIQDL